MLLRCMFDGKNANKQSCTCFSALLQGLAPCTFWVLLIDHLGVKITPQIALLKAEMC